MSQNGTVLVIESPNRDTFLAEYRVGHVDSDALYYAVQRKPDDHDKRIGLHQLEPKSGWSFFQTSEEAYAHVILLFDESDAVGCPIEYDDTLLTLGIPYL